MADDILNIDWSKAEGIISGFKGQTSKFQEQCNSTTDLLKGIGDDMWSGAGRQAFDGWLQKEFLPSLKDVAEAMLPGFGDALGGVFSFMQSAETEMSQVVGTVQQVANFFGM